jgi:hypothetical protein
LHDFILFKTKGGGIMGEKQPFKQALETIKDAVCDLTSLEVQTYVGDLDVIIKEAGDPKDFDTILEKGKTSGKLKLTYVTKIEFDGDGKVLVPSVVASDHIQQAHNAAIKAGQDIRLGLLSLFSDITGLKVTKS